MAVFASKIAPSHGKINCIASGTMMGLVDKKDEYQESSSRSPMISLRSQSAGAGLFYPQSIYVPLHRLHFTPCFPPCIDIGNCLIETHVENLSFCCSE